MNHLTVLSGNPITRSFSVESLSRHFATYQLYERLQVIKGDDHGLAEAYFSGIEGDERIKFVRGNKYYTIDATVNYGYTSVEERLHGALDGY